MRLGTHALNTELLQSRHTTLNTYDPVALKGVAMTEGLLS